MLVTSAIEQSTKTILVMSSEVETSLDVYATGMTRDLIRSLPVRSASGLPVYVAASPSAPFSTALRSARNDKLAGGRVDAGFGDAH